ncbi:MAG: DUF3685 domain-containing protein [Cyanobium sp.]
MTTQLLLLAEPLRAAGLGSWIESGRGDAGSGLMDDIQVVAGADALQGPPGLVLWAPAAGIPLVSLQREATLLRERWHPAPLLLVLSEGHGLASTDLLLLASEGLLEAPDASQLLAALNTLLGGGRVLELQPGRQEASQRQGQAGPTTIGQALLLSGLQQLDIASSGCRLLLSRRGIHPLARLLLEGRLREMAMARRFLLWIWGPLSLAWSDPVGPIAGATARPQPGGPGAGSSSLTLQQRNASGVWLAVQGRLSSAIEAGLANRSGQLLALEGLNGDRRSDLLLALLSQLDALRQQLAEELAQTPGDAMVLLQQRWRVLQPRLREQALLAMASPYVQIPQEGKLQPVASSLVQASDLSLDDPELPDPQPMLATLVLARPLLVDGQLLPPDEPRAVLHLEQLVANWLLRNAELLAADVLACCGGWPELRRYLLRPELLATRNLERLRNQLNAQQRWLSWFSRPIALYESRRELLCLEGGTIASRNLLEPRDQELRRLGWLQQVVTLSLEARDAVGPQLRQLIRGIGDLLVVLLTQVVGRAIGLVGRGILQGMGRSLGRS